MQVASSNRSFRGISEIEVGGADCKILRLMCMRELHMNWSIPGKCLDVAQCTTATLNQAVDDDH